MPERQTEFTAYNPDIGATFDCADQRFYASTYGRFNTADQYMASGGSSDPSSWNRYSYALGDPVRYADPGGTNVADCDENIQVCSNSGGGGGGGYFYNFGDTEDGSDGYWDCFNCWGRSPDQQVSSGKSGGPSKSPGDIWVELGNAVSNAMIALSDPHCASVVGVGPNGESAASVLQDMWLGPHIDGTFKVGYIPTPVGTTASASTIGVDYHDGGNEWFKAEITINTAAGSFVTGNSRDQTITLLHELGHAMDFIFTNGASQISPGDAAKSKSDTGLSEKNTQTIIANCFGGGTGRPVGHR